MTRVCLLILILCLVAVCQIECKTFTRCALAKELKRQGFPKSQLSNWVCLVESESSRNTKLTHKNRDGSVDYGLFQINSRYWCSTGPRPGKDCNVRCKDLLTDNISTAARCAKKVYARHGFNAWYGWLNKCKGKALPNLSKCGV